MVERTALPLFTGKGVGRSIIGGGGAKFIYSCSQTVKTIDFKI